MAAELHHMYAEAARLKVTLEPGSPRRVGLGGGLDEDVLPAAGEIRCIEERVLLRQRPTALPGTLHLLVRRPVIEVMIPIARLIRLIGQARLWSRLPSEVRIFPEVALQH